MVGSASDIESPPTTPPSAQGAPAELICYHKTCKRAITSAKFSEAVYRNGAVFFAGLTLLIDWIGTSLFRLQSMASFVLFVGVIAVATALGHWLDRRSMFKGVKQAIESAALPDGPADSARLRCVGVPQAFEPEGEFADVPFEPELFFAPAAMRFAIGMKIITAASVVVGITSALSFLVVLVGHRVAGTFFVTSSAGAFLGLLVPIILWPTYIRIVPGRLDVLRFFAFKAKPVQRVSYDLKSAGILVDLPRRVVFIDPPSEPAVEMPGAEFSFKLISRPRRFAYYVLLAAISTHEPGPLPEDELLG